MPVLSQERSSACFGVAFESVGVADNPPYYGLSSICDAEKSVPGGGVESMLKSSRSSTALVRASSRASRSLNAISQLLANSSI
jgi:hypothetical protein